jgi:hypothetical protein
MTARRPPDGRPRSRGLEIAKPPMGSGVDPQTGEWTPQHPKQRPPYQPVHGGQATLMHQPDVRVLADELTQHVPGFSPGDRPLLELYCLCLCRVRKMNEWLAAHEDDVPEPENLDRVRAELRYQSNTSRRLADDLGLSPKARAAMAGDLAAAQAAASLRQRYGVDSG